MFSASVPARHRRQKFLVAACLAAIILALAFLLGLLFSIVRDGWGGFFIHEAQLQIAPAHFEGAAEESAPTIEECELAVKRALRARFADVSRRQRRELNGILNYAGAVRLCEIVNENPARFFNNSGGGEGISAEGARAWLPLSGLGDFAAKENAAIGKVTEQHLAWLEELRARGDLRRVINRRFFSAGDSPFPSLAGIGGALWGSIFTLFITFILAMPVGVAAAVYLEELSRSGRMQRLIEVTVNNLAAVPSVIFGLLGLGVFINVFGLPRSTPVLGGMVLALMTMPTVIIATRAALRAVPGSLRQGALALGATPLQAIFHHVLPNAAPGIITSAIIGMAQALGETAPLLMIGMVAFVAGAPEGFLDVATVLPVQIFLWADSPERAFAEKAATGIIVLLFFLLGMNAAAVWLRKRFGVRW